MPLEISLERWYTCNRGIKMKNPVAKLGCFFIGKISPRLRESKIAATFVPTMTNGKATGCEYLGGGF